MTRFALALVSAGLLGISLAPTARADQWDKKTIMTVNETIQVPNKVLPPGTYVVKLLDSQSDRHIVQIFNADESHLQTTILAIPNYRLQPTGKTVFTFWETPPGEPKALRAWFYPGDNFGQEFAYPKSAALQIASAARTPVPTTEVQQPTQMESAPVAEAQPAPAPQEEVAQTTPQAAEPAPAEQEPAAAAQEPAPQEPAPPAPSELPKTASPYPMVGLAGLLSLGLFGIFRVARTS